MRVSRGDGGSQQTPSTRPRKISIEPHNEGHCWIGTLKRVGIHICENVGSEDGRSAWAASEERSTSRPQPEYSDHSCRVVSLYGNTTTPPPILAIPKSIIPSRLWPPVPLLAFAPRPEVCVLGGVERLQVNELLWSLEASGSLPLPAVLTAPIRLDVVQQVHSTQMSDRGPRGGC